LNTARISSELVLVAKLLMGKKRPETRFEQEFFDNSAKIKAANLALARRSAARLATELTTDISAFGVPQVIEPKLGAFRGHSYITSCKIFVAMPKESIKALETMLRGKFSPKFNLKSYENGVALFNVR
jgi:hypothetical protein